MSAAAGVTTGGFATGGFTTGIVEGFYGPQWSWSQRAAVATRFAADGGKTYIYAPKGDHYLRKAWREAPDVEYLSELQGFRQHCAEQGLAFGLGISPLGLQAACSDEALAQFVASLQRWNQLNPDGLWLLFDDMPAGQSAEVLVDSQMQVLEAVLSHSNAKHIALCPSYYSEDPVLDEVFGQRPDNYWELLAQRVPAEVDILWTGPQVVSRTIANAEAAAVAQQLGRKPLLWDNYPVNDGRKLCKFLNLDALRERPSQDYLAGHFANPMNQAFLSQLALASLPALHQPDYEPERLREAQFERLPSELAALLRRDWQLFQRQGLDSLASQQRDRLSAEYRSLAETEMLAEAQEVADWLDGRYAFDPNCLTD